MTRLAVFLICAISVLHSGAKADWQQAGGPDGGPIKKLASNSGNGHLFAIANGMPYRSVDSGASWVTIASGMDGRFGGNAIASDGSDTYLTGIAGPNFPFYHSTSEGNSWTQMAAVGMPQFFSPDALFGSGANVIAASSISAGIYYSSDHGANWQAATGLPANFDVLGFVRQGNYTYAGSSLGSTVKGIYRSGDNGASWTATNATFLSGGSAYLTCISANSKAVFAGTGLTGVYRSTDSGATWIKVSPDAGSDFSSAMVATNSNLYTCLNAGRVDRSDSLGNGWVHVNTGLPAAATNESLPAIAASGSTIVAGTAKVGVYRTTNQGGLWSESNAGLHASKISGILAAGTYLYATSATNGFFRSADHGTSWTSIRSGIVLNGDWFQFVETSTGILGGAGLAHLYKSVNQGTTWTVSNTSLGLNTAACLARGGADTVYAAGNAGISTSVNAGASWSFQIAGTSIGETVLDVMKDGAYMIIGGDVGGCARSIDNGATWTAPVLGLPANGSNPAFARIDTVWLEANTGQGVYRSYDHGNHWTKSTSGISGAPWCLLVVDTAMYVGTTNGVWVSFNRGTNWSSFNSGLPDSIFVNKLSFDSQYLYAGTTKRSVWRYSRTLSCCTGRRGNVNCSGAVDLVDLSTLVKYLTQGGVSLCCSEAADVNGSGSVDLVDLSSLVSFLTGGGYQTPNCP